MSRYFCSDPPVPILEFEPDEIISDQPPNIIWIRAKMNVEIDGKVKSELITLAPDGKTTEVNLGANETALLVHNVVKWEGPDFAGVPCTEQNIRNIDPTEPHWRKVLDAIGERNKRREGPSPKLATPSMPTNGGAIDSNIQAPGLSMQLATTTPRSALRSALDGYQKKSENSTPII